MNEKNVFDINDVSDIPEKIRVLIITKGIGPATRQILSLFEIKNELSLNEIIVGLYRLFKIAKPRQWASSALYNLKRAGLIEKTENGTYRIIK